MWVTQTYIKSPEPNARLYLYYLFENYVEGQQKATKVAQSALEEFSRSVPEACILLPSERSKYQIEMEERSQGLLKKFAGALPGVLVSRKPLEKLDIMNDEAFYVQFNHEGFTSKGIYLHAPRFVTQPKKLMEITSEQLDIEDREPSKSEHVRFYGRFWRAIEMKPGILGFKIDLKQLLGSSR